MLNTIVESSSLESIRGCKNITQLANKLHSLKQSNAFDYGLGMAFLSRNIGAIAQYIIHTEPEKVLGFMRTIIALEKQDGSLSNKGLWALLGNLMHHVPFDVEMHAIISGVPINEDGWETAKQVIEHFNICWISQVDVDCEAAMDFIVQRYHAGQAKRLPKSRWEHYDETDKWKALYQECFNLIAHEDDIDWLENSHEFYLAMQGEPHLYHLLSSVTKQHPTTEEEMSWCWFAPLKLIDENPAVQLGNIEQPESELWLS